ncbi:OmpA family protein [Longimicrobium sp.]|uniref:OmpA/MotB family protein n=1 Tax=Longimicrobium sp. TaxID=2029185 RepID=UPI002BE8C36F|nr:OmpA family protein [Longimicrobium sp.]HSU17489.1 OmpA family protein [Longimicrobium sp.]
MRPGAGDEEGDGGPWPAFADLLAATTLLFLILFAALAVPAMQRAHQADAQASNLARIDSVLLRAADRHVSVQRVGDYVLVRIAEEATFPKNEHALALMKPEGRAILHDFGRFLSGGLVNEIDQVQVVGHTSSEGSDERNWVLSSARAATVALFLIDSAGVPACRVSALGRSHYYPVRPARARAGAKADPADRRIELEIRPQLPGDTVQRHRRDACVDSRR